MKLNMKRGLVFLLILTLMSSVMPFAFAAEELKWELKAKMHNLYTTYNGGDGTISASYNNNIYLFAGKTERNSTVYNKMEMYNSISNEWIEKKDLPVSRYGSEVVLFKDKAYLIGGINNGEVLLSYDFTLDSWETKSPLPATFDPKTLKKAVVINDKIYVVFNNLLAAYDPQSDTWESKAAQPHSLYSSKIEVVNDKIYAIMEDTKNSLSVREYDPTSNNWTTKKSARTYRRSFRSVVVDGKIYVLGGLDDIYNLSTVEMYDPAADDWTMLASMKDKRYDFKTIVINKEIYVLGGALYVNSSLTKTLNSVEKYNIKTNTWESLPPLNTSRAIQSQVHNINNSIFVFKGFLDSPESYFVSNIKPTLTVTASPNKVKVGNRFTTTVAIHNVSNIYAEDIKIDYDAERFEYLGASAKDGLKIYKEDTTTPGSVRYIVAHLGKDSGATGDKDLIELTFKAKSIGIGKVDITKGRIADNDVLEMDVAEENCGEDTIEVEANKDVNRTGEYTLLDLGIDAYYYGMQADQTDTTRFDTDVIPDGIIDDKDLTAITQSILDNSNYPFN